MAVLNIQIEEINLNTLDALGFFFLCPDILLSEYIRDLLSMVLGKL